MERKKAGKVATRPLALAVKYPTPCSCMTGMVTPSRCNDKFNNLESVLSRLMWPSPHSTCSTGPGSQGRQGGLNLQTAVAKYPTPTVDDADNSTLPVSLRDRGNLPGYCLRNGDQPGEELNPDWVEFYLMGWPLRWTSLEPLNEAVFSDWTVDPADTGDIPRVSKGVKNRTQRLKAIGNGQVPLCFAVAWQMLNNDHYGKGDQ